MEKIIDKFGLEWEYSNNTLRREGDRPADAHACSSFEDAIEWLKIFGYLDRGDDDES